MLWKSVADPGFPRGGGAKSPGGRQHTILANFPKNCMKLKEFGPPGGGGARPKFYYVDPPLEVVASGRKSDVFASPLPMSAKSLNEFNYSR